MAARLGMNMDDYHQGELSVFILGRAFKPNTNIETGSPAVLLSRILPRDGIPHESVEYFVPTQTGLYFIGTKHERWAKTKFPKASIVT